ncbi:MAG: O-antigen ligase family protein [Chloroflexi bacterium]|nr:O-antigen ligase family protein [Chloroflexota bacterium]
MIPKLQKIFWALFLLSLPVTSFPYFPSVMGGSALVRPLALYPLAGLLVLMLITKVYARPLPKTILPLLAFVLVAILSSVFAFTRGVDSAFEFSVGDRVVRNLITLGMGAAFYLVAALMPQSIEDLRSTLRWLYAGFSVALFWGSLQVVYILQFSQPYYDLLKKIQRYISIRRLFPKRISGLAYEPSWFAEQIVFLLMPWLLAAVLSNYTVFRWRWRRVTIEALLLFWATIVLVFTYSRTGLAALVLLLLLAFLLRPPNKGWSKSKKWMRPKWKQTAKNLSLAVFVIVILLGVVFAAGGQNKYFSRLWRYWTDEESTGTYLQYIAFSQRFIYWETAYRVYEEHPVLGVGLGNYVFYFEDALPDRPLYPTPEVLYKLVPEEGRLRIVTVKNFLIRIFAETGLLGTAAFVAFIVAVLGCALYLWFSPQAEQQYWGRAGLLGLAAFGIVSFSVDSFAIPNMWVVFGLITASAHLRPAASL